MSGVAPVAQLRRAGLRDAARLAELDRLAGANGHGSDVGAMREWLEHGGALFYEDRTGRALSSLRWREDEGGWRLEPMTTHPDARGQGYGRWLMTQVEALAIRHNVPWLRLVLGDEERLSYYRRMGYDVVEETNGKKVLAKRVGGTWQMQEAGRP